jgi:hypothetical protein
VVGDLLNPGDGNRIAIVKYAVSTSRTDEVKILSEASRQNSEARPEAED